MVRGVRSLFGDLKTIQRWMNWYRGGWVGWSGLWVVVMVVVVYSSEQGELPWCCGDRGCGKGGTELRFKTWWSAWTPTFPPPPSLSICSPSSHGPPSRRNRQRGVGERTSFHLQCFWTYYVLTQILWCDRFHDILMLEVFVYDSHISLQELHS